MSVLQKKDTRVDVRNHHLIYLFLSHFVLVSIHFHFVSLLDGAQASAYSVFQKGDTLPACWHALLRGVWWYGPPGKGGRQIHIDILQGRQSTWKCNICPWTYSRSKMKAGYGPEIKSYQEGVRGSCPTSKPQRLAVALNGIVCYCSTSHGIEQFIQRLLTPAGGLGED